MRGDSGPGVGRSLGAAMGAHSGVDGRKKRIERDRWGHASRYGTLIARNSDCVLD